MRVKTRNHKNIIFPKKTKKLKEIKIKRKKYIQKGAGITEVDFQAKCLEFMSVLSESSEFKTRLDIAKSYFLNLVETENPQFYEAQVLESGLVTSSSLVTPDKSNMQKYLDRTEEKLKDFDSLTLPRSIFFFNTHNDYGTDYITLPENVIICFLTGANKYSFIQFPDKINMFSHGTIEERKSIFENIYKYKSKYIDEEFECIPRDQFTSIDYFRESSWYYPGQLCTNSRFTMTVKEYKNPKKKFNLELVNEDTYQIEKRNEMLEDTFSKSTSLDVKLVDMLKVLDSSRKYIVIVTGCRMFSYDKQKFKDESIINFINLHSNYLLTQKLLNLELPPKTIPDFTVSLRTRINLFEYHIIDNVEAFKNNRDRYNPFSCNNHNIYKLLETINNESKPVSESFLKKVSVYQNTLTLSKNLLFAEKVKNLEHNKIIFGTDFFKRKIQFIHKLTKKFVDFKNPDTNEFLISLLNKIIPIHALIKKVNETEFLNMIEEILNLKYIFGNIITSENIEISTPKKYLLVKDISLEKNQEVIKLINTSIQIKNILFNNFIYDDSCDELTNQYDEIIFSKCVINKNINHIYSNKIEFSNKCEIQKSVNINYPHVKYVKVEDSVFENITINCLQLQELHLENIIDTTKLNIIYNMQLKKINFTNIDFSLVSNLNLNKLTNLEEIILQDVKLPSQSYPDFTNFPKLTCLILINLDFPINFDKIVEYPVQQLKVITLKSLTSLTSTEESIEIALQKNLPVDCDDSHLEIMEAFF